MGNWMSGGNGQTDCYEQKSEWQASHILSLSGLLGRSVFEMACRVAPCPSHCPNEWRILLSQLSTLSWHSGKSWGD